MKDECVVYCDLEFIKNFFRLSPYEKGYTSINDFPVWNNIYCFIQKADITFYNSTDSDFAEYINQVGADYEFMEPVYQKFVNCEFEQEDILQEHVDYNAVYLTDLSTSECEEKSKQLGVLVFNYEKIIKSNYIFEDNGSAIKENSKGDWSMYLKEPNYKICNSMIITDNYLLKDKDKMDDNLFPILDALLPETLNTTFDLTCFCKDMNGQEKQRFDSLCKELSTLRPNIKFKVSLFKTLGDFHDRFILTNTLWFSCDGGFDLFSSHKAKKETKTDVVFPFFIQNIKKYPHLYLNQIYATLRVYRRDHTQNFDYWGENKNRLLDYYKK